MEKPRTAKTLILGGVQGHRSMANRFFLAFLAKLLSFHLRIVDLTQAVTYILAEYTRACEN